LRQPQVGQNLYLRQFQQFRRKSYFWPTCGCCKSGKNEKKWSDLRLPQVGESLKKWKKLATCGSRKSHQNKKIGATKNLMIVLLIH